MVKYYDIKISSFINNITLIMISLKSIILYHHNILKTSSIIKKCYKSIKLQYNYE